MLGIWEKLPLVKGGYGLALPRVLSHLGTLPKLNLYRYLPIRAGLHPTWHVLSIGPRLQVDIGLVLASGIEVQPLDRGLLVQPMYQCQFGSPGPSGGQLGTHGPARQCARDLKYIPYTSLNFYTRPGISTPREPLSKLQRMGVSPWDLARLGTGCGYNLAIAGVQGPLPIIQLYIS